MIEEEDENEEIKEIKPVEPSQKVDSNQFTKEEIENPDVEKNLYSVNYCEKRA